VTVYLEQAGGTVSPASSSAPNSSIQECTTLSPRRLLDARNAVEKVEQMLIGPKRAQNVEIPKSVIQ